MPNTLVHIGLQTLFSKAIRPGADVKWVALGCIIPDLPWILQRIVRWCAPSVDPIDLRAYVTIQASLFFCLIFCGSIAMLTRQKRAIFLLLGGNALLHLLLDSLQIKWANGVHLLAPFSWHLTSAGLLWPENWSTVILTLIGGLLLLVFATRDRGLPSVFQYSNQGLLIALLLLTAYLTMPLSLLNGPLASNNHYIHTISNHTQRTGKDIHIDRGVYTPERSTIRLFTGEILQVTSIPVVQKTRMSVQGTFRDNHTITVEAYHLHSPFRDYASLVGLFATLLIWLLAIFVKGGKVDPSQPL